MTRESCNGFGFERSRETRQEVILERGGPGTRLLPDDQGPDLPARADSLETLPEGWPAVQPSLLRQLGRPDDCRAGRGPCHAPANWVKAIPRCLEHWGILAASRFLGRSSLVVALDRFRSEGVWGVSPHLIPHYALHSPAGTLSLALGVHGPNLGIGGGLFSEFEGS